MSDVSAPRTWLASPFARVVGAVGSWFLLGLCFALLFQASVALIGVGGMCASGGPYEIRVECPESVALFMPLSIFGGFIAVGISLAVARGFGTPLATLAWPILFCGLGVLFLWGFTSGVADWSWLLIFLVFEAMGLAPLVLGLRANAREVVIGSVSIEGTPFTTPESGRTWLPRRRRDRDEAVEPTARDWLLAIVTTLIGGGLGVLLGVAVFRSVG